MAQLDSQRPLGPTVILASLIVLFGGAAYYVMTGADDTPPRTPYPAPNAASTSLEATQPPAAPGPPEKVGEAEEPDEPETPSGPARAALPVPSAAVLAMATAPKVTPEERSEEVLGALEDAKGKFQACTAPWAARNPEAAAKAFFVFEISDEGRASDISLQLKGVRKGDYQSPLEACLRNVLSSLSFESPAEKVFWPAALGGDAVFEPLAGSDP